MAASGRVLAEFDAAGGGGADGFHEGRAETVFLEDGEAGDGGASWAGDHVAEDGGVEAGGDDHFGGADDRLGGELEGGFAGQAGEHAAVGEGFDDGVDVSWSAAAEAGHGVEVFF